MKKKQLIALGAIVFVLAAACSNPFFPEKQDNGGVNNDIPVAGVSLNKTTLTLDIGGTETLIATVAPANAANKAVTWSSSNTAVATVSNGAVTAVSAGSAEITVTTEDGGKIASCAVTVAGSGPQTVAYTGADGEGTSYELEITGDDYVLTVTDEDGNTKTSAGKVVDDDGNGTLTLAPDADPDETFTITLGEDEITDIDGTITFDDGTKKEPPVIVNPVSITVAAVTVTPPAKGDTPVYTADTGDEGYTCGTVTWSPAVSSTFLGNTKYTATVTLAANENYVFSGGLTAKINDTDAVITNNTGSAVTLSLEFDATLALAVTGIAIKTQPTKLNYTHGDNLDLAGLEVTLTFEDSTSEDFALADFGTNISTVPANGAALSHTDHDGEPVIVSFGELTAETDDLTVAKANPTVTWPTAAAITYGAALSTSTLSGGVGAGTFAWTNGATIPTVTNSGYQVTFTPTDTANYNTLTQNVSITVSKANPTVTWPAGLTATYGQTLSNIPLPGNGSGSPAGTFTWTTLSDSVGAVGTQPHNMTFTPTDTANYNTLTQNVSITVLSYNLGDTGPGGGIIFYVSEEGFTVEMADPAQNYTAHYLEAAPTTTGTSIEWGDYDTLISGVTTFTATTDTLASKIGNGRKDTALIAAHLAAKGETNRAAQICAELTTGGKNDWFLPSLGELNELYKQRALSGINISGYYWSSSQRVNNLAWVQYFTYDGYQNDRDKYLTFSVHAVRAF